MTFKFNRFTFISNRYCISKIKIKRIKELGEKMDVVDLILHCTIFNAIVGDYSTKIIKVKLV